MSRPEFNTTETYLGDGSLAVYSFDFKIEELTQLLIIETNSGVQTQRVRGDDIVYLSGVTFDAIRGGGEVTLAANLANGRNLRLLLANDEPTQPYEFKGKSSFTMQKIESAFDFIAGAIQRLKFQAKKSLQINDADDESDFDPELPIGIANNPNALLTVNSAGNGFAFGPTVASIISTILNGLSFIHNTSKIDLLAGGSLTPHATKPFQNFTVSGDVADITMSTTPFGVIAPADRALFCIMGLDDTKKVKFTNNNIAYGCILNGPDIEVGAYETFYLRYYAAPINRYVFENRSF